MLFAWLPEIMRVWHFVSCHLNCPSKWDALLETTRCYEWRWLCLLLLQGHCMMEITFAPLYGSEFIFDTPDINFICIFLSHNIVRKLWMGSIVIPPIQQRSRLLFVLSNNLHTNFAVHLEKWDHSSADKILPDKRAISSEPSQSLHPWSPKKSKLCFLCHLSRGVSDFCIFYSEAFRDKE